MSSLQNKYNLIKEGKGNKDGLLRESKRMFPNYIPNSANFNQAVEILKSRQIISENYVDLTPINSIGTTKKESFETAFESYLKEAKAEEKKTSSEVTDVLAHQYDVRKEDELNNKIFDQLMAGYYAELKDPKNEGKTAEEIKDIVLKNLEKDPIHYVKDGQFGVKGLGYTDEAPGLGKPEEPTGKYKASGYGDLKESKEIVTEEAEIPSEEELTEMEDLVDAIADFSDNKEDCVKKVLTLCPEWKDHETTLLQLAEPKF